ncbi:SMAD/FHA domain-containing protein [Mycotypha africana]|uniref:SMAD/FHA domain-containing protein n=1 Tax=Mycotypha africana TaxID=64632 RepID=UPI0023007CC9|nr:SMAD/FHA domain-containing protein [Mycotypha africana]KAI8991282.1 SMAD/FHA domain-containing protein [Mycotypha africana]
MGSRSKSPSYRRRNSSPSKRYSRSPPSSRRRGNNSRSRSPPPRLSRSNRSRSPQRRQNRDESYRNNNRHYGNSSRRSADGDKRKRGFEWGRPEDNEAEQAEEPIVEKAQPNFGLSGKLAAETNTVNGVELKYTEPPEAAKPTLKWRLYVFKGSEQIDLLHIHRSSSLLIGRDRAVADIPVDHPSCSKQHAVLQYRLVNAEDDTGKPTKVVKPFIIDLESTNGTFLNGDKIPQTRYVELRAKDVLKFGESTREYVLLHA